MKNTILKMAGTKDEKSFYKKYPTEAAFLKAHPKAKAELKKFATGGQIGKNIGAGLYGVGEGLLDTITLGATDQLTDMGYKALQKAGGSTEDEIREQDSIHGYSQAAGAIGGGFLNPAGVGTAINQTGKGLGEGISKGSESEDWARTTGQVLNSAGMIGSMAYGNFGSSAGKGIKTGITTNAGKSSGNFLNPSNMMGQTQFGVAKYGGIYNIGGMQQYQVGGLNNSLISPKIINNAQKVGTVPSNYNKIGSQDNRTYYDVASDKAKSNPLGNGTGPNPGWEQSIIKRLQSGTSAQSLADAGHISSSQIEKYNQYYKPVYTETEPVKTEPIPLNTEQFNPRQETNFGQKYQTFEYPDPNAGYSKATRRYFDPQTNNEIDVVKSFDPKGNYIPSFLPINSSSNNIPENTMPSKLNFPGGTYKYGGMKYAMGGEIQYANGGTGEINAEVEDNENAIGPNGEFTQFSGPTHAQGGIETDMAPGTMIFSDKLKMPGSKKSFAALNKLYDTNKEDNVLSSEKSNNTLKLTAMLMRDAKLKQSLALFQAQEQFKQDKVAAYAKRMGVQIPSQDNEQMEPQGMPEQSEGEMAMGGFNSYQNGGMKDYMPIIAEGAAEARQELMNYKPNIYDFAEGAAEGRQEFFQNNINKPLPYLNFNFKDDQGRPVGPQNTFPQYQNQKYQVGGFNDRMNYTTRNLDNNSYDSYRKINTETGPRFYNASSPDLSTANKMIDFKIRNNQSDSIPMNQIPQNVITNFKNYQVGGNTDPGKLSDIQRQLRVVKQQISVIQPDSQYVSVPLAKLRGLEKDLTIRQNNHPEFKKAMGGRFPMYQDGDYVDPNAGSPGGKGDGNSGFDWANAGKQVGQFALQNVGNLYDLGRSTQDNSKLNLARYSPDFLDKKQDLANNQRMYSEGKIQTAQASQGSGSTFLNNMAANRASKLDNDFKVNTTYGNLNAQIANSAKLYNAGAIDKETMFKLQAEGANRNLRGQALSGMGQNLINQQNTNRKFASEAEAFGAMESDYDTYFKVKKAKEARLAAEKAKKGIKN